MKALKLNHDFANLVLAGKLSSTWRINDDKDLRVNDKVTLLDKVSPLDPASWVSIGQATITCILEKQIGQVLQQDLDENERLLPLDELLVKYRGYYGQQITAETPVKIIRFTFQKNASEGPQQTIVQEMKLFSDGGSRGNPGPSACGYVLMNMNDEVVRQNGLFLGVTTNNQAEYQSLKLGLEAALDAGVQILHVFMDSTLVVNQMKGIYKVKNQDLVPVNREANELVKRFTAVVFTYVPREHNRQADAIVNKVLDSSAD